MPDSRLINCPCCGSTATVNTNCIEMGWYTASVNCDGIHDNMCSLQLIAGGDTEEDAVEAAIELWNRRAAVAGEQFAIAVHDGRTWVCVEDALASDAMKPIKGFTRDSLYRHSMREYIEWMERATKLMRDLWALTDEMFRFKVSPSINTMAEFEERLEEFGIGGNDD